MDISSDRDRVSLQPLAASYSDASTFRAFKPPVVLVVDDDADNLQLACYIVEQAGYVALSAGSGKDALVQVQEHEVHLVLLDIVLPDMDGFQVIKQLQQRFSGQLMPVVALTALATESERLQMIDAGFSSFLCKPYAIDDLEAILGQYCPLSGLASLQTVAR
ncbi:response regulator [Pseudanabaena sp. FACHB-2040]|uniref:response regulator n=1 Tax=Pseudanabaena sp. FACHB-2040 TaxID=2692859 RepID=UPI001685D782|nr:response regulator [Pseudanabaena sp. FACHB-2040]MBD2256011.1 response regulator [Pseudanabaena sp. FACHB-2040]